MKLIILGSGGNLPTPRPFCECEICTHAKSNNSPYKRNSSCMFIEDIETLIDVPEDIANSLIKQNVKNVKRLFITHWHPDHVFGLRVLLQSKYDFFKKESKEKIKIYTGKTIYEKIKKIFPSIEYHEQILKNCEIIFLEDEDEILFEQNISITAIDYKNEEQDHYAYLIKQTKETTKKAIYIPCDTIDWKRKIPEVDLLINECGIVTPYETEISFDDLMKRLKEQNIKRTILTHIEEVDFTNHGIKKFKELKEKYKDINFEFGYDGQIIKL